MRDAAVAMRLSPEIRTEIETRLNADEAPSMSHLIRNALLEYFDNHPRPDDDTEMPRDWEDHGKYCPELNQLRQAAADTLDAAITITISSNEPHLGRRVALAHADIVRKAAVAAQAEYTIALEAYNESRRHD